MSVVNYVLAAEVHEGGSLRRVSRQAGLRPALGTWSCLARANLNLKASTRGAVERQPESQGHCNSLPVSLTVPETCNDSQDGQTT